VVDGDIQADIVNHGGRWQAVYAYARESCDAWEEELACPLPNAYFGENLTLEGVAVDTALVGERRQVGGALVGGDRPAHPVPQAGLASGRSDIRQNLPELHTTGSHRHPDVWDRPLAFDPQRFVDDRPRHRFAYFPFGGGPRLCIGAEFALVEAVLVLTTLLQSVDVDPVPGFPVTPWVGVTLRPAHGVRVTVQRR